MLITILRKLKYKYSDELDKWHHQKFLNKHTNLKVANTTFTHLTAAEKRKLFELASKLKSGYAVEIGSFIGASACFISAGLCEESKLLCIDTWENDAMSEGKRNTKDEFDYNTQQFQEKIIKIQGYSTEVKEKVLTITDKLDLLFIDGDHSYEGCKADWDLYIDMVKSGGCVIFHDSGWAEGVQRVIEADAKPIMVAYDSLPNMFWGYIK
jgi:predicted O-methyltransferase YrrM